MIAAYWVFVKGQLWLNMVYPIMALAGTYTMLTVYRFLTEERERRRIKEAFQHYVAPDVVEIMLGSPEGVRLGGHEAVLTALFSDLEGFTSFSERQTPTEIIAVLGDYYAEMTEQVFAHQGTLVEYVGDELFALFGAPVPQADHAKRACATALARSCGPHRCVRCRRPPATATFGPSRRGTPGPMDKCRSLADHHSDAPSRCRSSAAFDSVFCAARAASAVRCSAASSSLSRWSSEATCDASRSLPENRRSISAPASP